MCVFSPKSLFLVHRLQLLFSCFSLSSSACSFLASTCVDVDKLSFGFILPDAGGANATRSFPHPSCIFSCFPAFLLASAGGVSSSCPLSRNAEAYPRAAAVQQGLQPGVPTRLPRRPHPRHARRNPQAHHRAGHSRPGGRRGLGYELRRPPAYQEEGPSSAAATARRQKRGRAGQV